MKMDWIHHEYTIPDSWTVEQADSEESRTRILSILREDWIISEWDENRAASLGREAAKRATNYNESQLYVWGFFLSNTISAFVFIFEHLNFHWIKIGKSIRYFIEKFIIDNSGKAGILCRGFIQRTFHACQKYKLCMRWTKGNSSLWIVYVCVILIM